MPDADICLRLLRDWADFAERDWYPLPGRQDLGCYGSGYNSWGVQTNQKYLAGMVALAVRGDGRALDRALAALRFSLASHVSGELCCTDGTRWGHTWISALGIERMMHGVYLLEPHFTESDHAALRRMLCSEADWLVEDHERGAHKGIVADRWASSGKNAPESNIWNGALLWRVAAMYPEAPRAADWRDMARRFLINGVSVPDDADTEPRSVGANFFPHYALDHHGYLNVGYMVICVSNVAMLHFDLRLKGLERPEELDHHQCDLWQAIRGMIFADGRLARIGGDSRLRYTYCQEYLLPSLLYAAGHLGDGHAPGLADVQLRLMAREADANGDGGFFSKRLADVAAQNPYYYTRVESDRACVLSMALAYGPLVEQPEAPEAPFEASVAGAWCEPEHGAVLHRCPTRLASFAWRARGVGQGMCQPPDDGHLAEWQQNMGGLARFLDDAEGAHPSRSLLQGHVHEFEGGFLACGAVSEGASVLLNEGWRGEDLATHQIVFAALPDGHTVVGLEHARTGEKRTYLGEVQGMHLNLPNDIYNGFERTLTTASGETILAAPAAEASLLALDSRWASIDERVGVLGLYGAETLCVRRPCCRRGGPYGSLYSEEIAWHALCGPQAVDPGTVVLDVGWAVAASVTSQETRQWAETNGTPIVDSACPDVRCVRVVGLDGQVYVVLANFGAEPCAVEVAPGQDLLTGAAIGKVTSLDVMPAEGRVFRLAAV